MESGQHPDDPTRINSPLFAGGSVRARWGDVAAPGYQPLPDVFLFHQAEVGLSSEELNVLLNVMAHWYDPQRMPFPRPTTIARRMGVSERTIQRLFASLVEKGFLRKVKAQNATGSVAYDLQATVEKFRPYAQKRLARAKPAPAGEAA
jgi:predicted transcriptional regulator